MLTIQFVSYSEIESLSSIGRIRTLLNMVKEEKIVFLEGRLTREEETELIKTTMEEINESFRGIELATVNMNNKKDDILMQKIKNNFISILLGNRSGFTVIGPASIVRSIKKDPTKIQLLTRESKGSKVKKKRKR